MTTRQEVYAIETSNTLKLITSFGPISSVVEPAFLKRSVAKVQFLHGTPN